MSGILVVDDYAIARTTIRELLRWHEIQVCGEAKDGREAVEKVKQLNPDVVLLDINMPVMNGMQAALEIRRVSPRTKILFLSVIGAEEARAGARLLGDGYIQKSNAGTELIPALQRLLPALPPKAEHGAN
ncbi:MAG TPA: response regulator transcription factor [Candidatus Acidoferrales bacterium]|nr:response regulator transcription factor [Candidatus Acidoferrales bacterium]